MRIYDDFPFDTPKLLRADSFVETCASCGKWVERYPKFLEGDYFWQCYDCGCTSTKCREGRPFGKKSRDWETIVNNFNKMWTSIPYWDWETIVTDPPMKSLDWKAINEWYHSQGMYGAVTFPDEEESTE